jgi:hypothetical protein
VCCVFFLLFSKKEREKKSVCPFYTPTKTLKYGVCFFKREQLLYKRGNLSTNQNVLYSSLIELLEATDYVESACEMYNTEHAGGAQLVLFHRNLFCWYTSLLRVECLLVMI